MALLLMRVQTQHFQGQQPQMLWLQVQMAQEPMNLKKMTLTESQVSPFPDQLM